MNDSVAEDYRGEPMSRAARFVYGSVLTVMSVCGLLGTVIVLSALRKDRIHRLASASCKVYIVSLVITDVCFQAYVIPLTAVGFFRGRYPAVSDLHCSLTGCIALLSFMVFNFMAVLISVDRYVRVFRGAVYGRYFSVRKNVAVCVVVWTMTALMTLPLTLKDRLGFDAKLHTCFVIRSENIEATIVVVVFLAVVFFSLAVPNVLTFRAYKKNLQRVAQWQTNESTSNPSHRAVQTSDVALLKSLLAMFVCFVLLTLPTVVMKQITKYADVPRDVAPLPFIFLCLNASVNWLFLAVFNKRFGEAYRQLLC